MHGYARHKGRVHKGLRGSWGADCMEIKKMQERQRAGITVKTQHGHEQRVCCASASFSATVFHHQVKIRHNNNGVQQLLE